MEITATSVVDATMYDTVTLTVASRAWEVRNPYDGVDWTTTLREKANLHTHTTESDGDLSPAEAIDAYHALGYGVLALTDHDLVTWPWTAYGRDAD